MKRIERLVDAIDGRPVLISHPDHVYYFTNCQVSGATFLIFSDKRQVCVGPQSQGGIDPELSFVGYNDSLKGMSLLENICETISSVLQLDGEKILYVETTHLPMYLHEVLQNRRIQTVDGVLLSLRRNKDGQELRQMRINQSINEQVFQAIPHWLKQGRTTAQIFGRINELFHVLTDGTAHVDGCFGAGVQSDNPDAQPGDIVLNKGDHLFVDLYPRINRYYADLTRVFSIGSVSVKQQDVFSALEESLRRAESKLGPGVSCKHIDDIVHDCIGKHGYEGFFPHHTGHGLGMAQQEPPFITRDSTDVLQPGDIIAVEPGIYVPGWGGMRLESTYHISGNGVERLDGLIRETIIPSVFL